MLKRLTAVCVILAIATPVLAQTVVSHVTNKVTGWRGGNNNSPGYSWMDAWPGNGSWGNYQDATLAEFDRAALQTAINSAIDTAGGWDAKILVTQPDWASTANPATALPGLQPVLGSAQVDAAAISWATAQSFNAGLGSWALSGTTYSTFGAAVLAGVPTGKSAVFDVIPWITEGGPTLWSVVMDAPENLLVQYMQNTSATGLFASAKTPYGSPLIIYQNQNGGSDLRVRIDAPPTGAPWMNAVIGGDAHALWVSRTIVSGASPVTVAVQVNNARTGTLAWTAAEAPDATWLSLTSASGGNGATFQMTLNASGVAVGTYSTTVVITDNASGNKTVTIPVTLTVQSASPVIQLVPTSLSFQASTTGANPTPQTVTVNNTGSGTLAWTAAESPDVSWLSLSPTTGGNGASFTVTVDKTGLAMNVYTATIRVTDPGASNSPQTVTVTLTVADQDADIVKANSYDDAWQNGDNGWIAAMQQVRLNSTGKTSGFVVMLGDSITYANSFGQWARYGSGKTTADTTICNWMDAANWGTGTNASDNGWYLAAWDVPSRNGSFTARSGITAAGYLTGYAAPDLPGMDKMFSPGFTNPDGKQYNDALMAVILLGTNDIGGNNASQLSSNLSSIMDKLIAVKVIPILTTLPPRVGSDTTVASYNTAIRTLAQTRKVPLIDFWTEITRRRPVQTWQNTLISSDGVHPTGSNGAYSSSSDPYASGGAALSNVGYLLRCWLTVQKIAEVKAAVLDTPVVPSNPAPSLGQTNVAKSTLLTWTGAASGVTFDIYLDTVNPPVAKVATAKTAASYLASNMLAGTTYYWKVVAINSAGQTPSPVWSFTTIAAPAAPSNPSPANGAVNVATNATLSWSGAASGVTFDVYFGTTNPPLTKVVADQAAATYTPASLTAATRYYWYVVAKNGGGNTTGTVWSFLTTIPSDINGDGHVNSVDLLALASAFGSVLGNGNYSAACDINKDNKVNVVDLLYLADSFGLF